MKSLELFSGMGGLARGLQIAGATHEAFVEFNKDACASLRENYNSDIVHEVDVRHFDFSQLGNVDLVAGGPPCQPFSVGGKHDGNHDDRDMFPFAIKAVATLEPKAFVFENVKGLLRKNFSDYFSYIIKRLEFPSEVIKPHETWSDHLKRLLDISYTPEYRVQFKLLNAANYGVPQVRERVVIVGIRKDLDSEWKFPTPTHSMESLDWAMRYSGEYWEKHQISRKASLAILEFLENRNRPANSPYGLLPPDLHPWRTVRDAIGDLPEPDDMPTIPDHKLQLGARAYPGHTGSDLDWPSKTIKAGGHGVPGGENMIRLMGGKYRYFSVLEAKRLQTFPDDYSVLGSWGEAMRQIGNAVPVQLGAVIGGSLMQFFKQERLKVALESS